MTKNAIIFDMDGTMWDTTEAILPVWNEVLRKYSNETSKQISKAEMDSYMGKTLEQIAQLSLPELDIKRGFEILSECCKTECKSLEETGAIIYPMLIGTLKELKEKYSLLIVSNCQDGYIQSFLTYYKLWDMFDDFEFAGRTGKTKGENIKLIMERNNTFKAVYVGDTQSDFEAAKFAEIDFIFAEYGFGNAENYKYSIKEFSDLPNLIKKIF
ncbi:MAG: HAD family hydrolase [Ruminococcus sp.]|nr:HAD family hydrolase [Ruminococcus sp.]